MTPEELDALIATHDTWTAYDVLLLILMLTFGLALVAGSFLALEAQQEGLAAIMVTPGVLLVLFGLNKQPYQAR